MFLAADVVVKVVMIGLVAASVLVWTIALVKGLELAGATMRARRALRLLADATSLEEAQRAFAGRRGAPARLVRALAEEWRESEALGPRRDPAGLRERAAIRMARIEKAASRRLSAGIGLLAVTASAAPFLGLFGTVWGIMNAFVGIAEAQTTNLAVVAPGIAEALLATGIGPRRGDPGGRALTTSSPAASRAIAARSATSRRFSRGSSAATSTPRLRGPSRACASRRNRRRRWRSRRTTTATRKRRRSSRRSTSRPSSTSCSSC